MSIQICSLTLTEGSSQIAGSDLHIFKDVAGGDGTDGSSTVRFGFPPTRPECLRVYDLQWLTIKKIEKECYNARQSGMSSHVQWPIQNINAIQVKSKEELYVYRLLH